MNVTDTITHRRSIRVYTEQNVEPEKVERILRAGMQAPSAKNQQPWEFIVVRNKATLKDISQMHEYAGMAAGANVAIVALARTSEHNGDMAWYAPDMGACVENIMLQIVEEGLGGCWLGFYPIQERIDKMRNYFSLPDDITPFAVVTLGYTVRENKFKDRYIPERVHFEKY